MIRMGVLLVMGIALVLLIPAPGLAVCYTSYPECGPVPTDNCRITQDTIFVSATYLLTSGINICADDVTLDCNGAVLEGFVYYDDGIYFDEVQGATVKNCIVRDYMYNIRLIKSPRSIVENNTIVDGSVGVEIWSSPGSIFRSNTGTGNSAVFWASRTEGLVFHDNLAIKNSIGFDLDKVNASVIARNTVVENSYNAVQLDDSFNNTIIGNMLDENGGGIRMVDSQRNLIRSNTISHNKADGISLVDSRWNTILENQIAANNNSGIHFADKWIATSANNTVAKNMLAGNWIGLSVFNQKSNTNMFFLNSFLRNRQLQATDPAANTWYSAGGQQGNYWSDFDTPDEGCVDLDLNGVCDAPYSIPGGSNQDPFPLLKPPA